MLNLLLCMCAYLFWISFILVSLQSDSSSILFQVWDNMIIESALKTFYGSDIAVMIKAIQRNFTVCFSFFLLYGDKDTTITHIRETLPTKRKHKPVSIHAQRSAFLILTLGFVLICLPIVLFIYLFWFQSFFSLLFMCLAYYITVWYLLFPFDLFDFCL